jgi:type II restriction enzyme
MKYNPLFKQFLDCSDSNEVFNYLKNNLRDSISTYDYYVNWCKVLGNIKDFEIDLNTLNYLVGKENVLEEACTLFRKYPHLVRLVPILLACRENNFTILMDNTDGKLQYKKYDFYGKPSDHEIDNACEFMSKTGVLDLFKSKTIKSVPDYVLGVEVGLDSNGRKNRSGTTMETIVKNMLGSVCPKNSFELMEQATSQKIKNSWGFNVTLDKTNRQFDFAIKNQDMLYLIETNYYGHGGSKLKATAGEYKTLFDFISNQGYRFVWITDGLGWNTTLRSLEETFNHIDYTMNLDMISTGLLSNIIAQKL